MCTQITGNIQRVMTAILLRSVGYKANQRCPGKLIGSRDSRRLQANIVYQKILALVNTEYFLRFMRIDFLAMLGAIRTIWAVLDSKETYLKFRSSTDSLLNVHMFDPRIYKLVDMTKEHEYNHLENWMCNVSRY